jgi:hypothetical protein
MSDLKPNLDLINRQTRPMSSILFEVHCQFSPEHPVWNNMSSFYLEIGYPGRSGPILWKHIGWISQASSTAGRNFSHALWTKENSQQVLEFDFLPVYPQNSEIPEQSYRIRKHIVHTDGRIQRLKSRILKGDYHDEFVSLKTSIQ